MKLHRTLIGATLVPFMFGIASAAPWTVDKEASSIDYAYTWSGVAAGGDFGAFEADIDFDKADLENSSVRVVIDMSSVSAAYNQVPTELVKPDWFDVAQYPQAVFESTSFTEKDDGSFVAKGILTMRGVAHPSELVFRFDSYGPVPDKPNTLLAVMQGETTISRTAYGVGQGSWAATDTLADEVVVKVKVTAEKPTDQ